MVSIPSHRLALKVDDNRCLELDIQKCVVDFTVSKSFFPKPRDAAKMTL
jgi:hypothetical protein